MIVSCTNCKAQYSVNDSKIQDKIFGFTCPKCGTSVEIDNRAKSGNTEIESHVQLADTFDKGSITDDFSQEAEQDSSASFSGEEELIGDDGLIGDINEPSGEGEIGFDDETDSNAAEMESVSKPEQELGLPSEDDLADALENMSFESEDEDSSLSIEDMNLPDLETLGDISDAGETADDAINKTGDEILPDDESDLEQGVKLKKEYGDTLLDVLGDDDSLSSEEIESDIQEDFNPIEDEEEIPVENGVPGKSATGDEPEEAALEEIESDSISIDDMKDDEIFAQKAAFEEEDENITIDLDSLDIQLEEEYENQTGEDRETEELSGSFEPMNVENLDIEDFEGDIEEIETGKEKKAHVEKSQGAGEEEEDITLDLDALDLTLDEVEELKEGEAVDSEDERITLSDAGLSPDELVDEDETEKILHTEEDIRLNIDEIVPEVGEISVKKGDDLDFLEDDLPEIDMEALESDDLFQEDTDIDDMHYKRDFKKHELEIASPDADIRDTVPGGMINFSIDYSLKYSRIGAILRLLCIYPIFLIPHFIVLLVYSVLSSILSFFNWIIIAISGMHEEDFTWIQENTIRYMLSLSVCCLDVVEDMPKFAGRKDIDYPLQFDATYPIRYSRILAILRITVIGILITMLPHLFLFMVLSVGCAVVYLIGIISIILFRKWPKSLFDFMVRYYRYYANILSFITGVIDRYPSFRFE